MRSILIELHEAFITQRNNGYPKDTSVTLESRTPKLQEIAVEQQNYWLHSQLLPKGEFTHKKGLDPIFAASATNIYFL